MEITSEHEEVDHQLWPVKNRDAVVRDGGQEDHSAQRWCLRSLLL